jgi:hypothetical protein
MLQRPAGLRLTVSVTEEPRYLAELSRYVEENLNEPTPLTAALAALLTDPAAYTSGKGQPARALVDFVEELVLRNRPLHEFMQDAATPVARALIDDRWSAVWRGARSGSKQRSAPEYDVCISFAGSDRATAKQIADEISGNGMHRKVFYDEFEKTTLWGEELFRYLYEMYSQRSKFCVILFSHAYRQRAWTRHELRAAQTRTLQEQQAYVLPVALDDGAVPDEFAGIGYWSFQPGDESRIAAAIEEKINDYIGAHFYSAEQMTDVINRDTLGMALLDGFGAAIKGRLEAADQAGAQVLTLLALIAAADMSNAKKSVRAIVNLVLFAPGVVGDIFDDDSLTVTGSARVRRSLGQDGPFLFSAEGWDDFFEPYRRDWDSLSGDENPDDNDPED